MVAGRAPLPLACPPAPAPALEVGQEIVTVATPLRTGTDLITGEVTGHQPRVIEADLRLAFGGTGGPVFDQAGTVAGLTALTVDADAPGRRGEAAVVRLGTLCEALAAAAPKLAGATPPAASRLPVEPAAPAPNAAAAAGAAPPMPASAGPVMPVTVASADFDLAFITAPMLRAAQERAGRTGGQPGRAQEVEARLGPLTEFDAWTEYFANPPPVLIVRVTPKMVEGFWKRLGREALRTQGAVLPPLKGFTGSFVRLRATCGGEEITPIHPFVLEHQLPGRDRDIVREGLYVFAPDAVVGCTQLTVSLYSEKAPDKADTIAIAPALLERIRKEATPAGGAGR